MESGQSSHQFLSIKRRPDKALLTIYTESTELTFGIDGDDVWQRVMTPGGSPQYELKSGQEAKALAQIGDFFDPIVNVLLFNKGRINRLEIDTWEGGTCLKLSFLTEHGIPTDAYFDPETLHPRARVEQFNEGRERMTLYWDYRLVDGIPEPFLIEIFMDGTLQNRVIVESSDHNIGTMNSIFTYPLSPAMDAPE